MATKKPAVTKKALAGPLKFRIEWIFDPGPEIFRLDRAAQAQLNRLKTDFAKRANEIISKGQQ
jgi:hypothetical protein